MERLELIIPLIMVGSMMAASLIACADVIYCKVRKLPRDPKVSQALRPAFNFFGVASLVSLGAMILWALLIDGCSGRSPYLY